jgi:two-component system, cell cycle sensor histidine kinase and response regulator CckA
MTESPLAVELDRIARLAARLLGGSHAFVSVEPGDLPGDEPAVSSLSRAVPEIVPVLRAHHVRSDDPFLLSAKPPREDANEPCGWTSAKLEACASVAIRDADGRPIGFLAVVDTQPREWGDQEVEALSEFAEMAGVLLDQAAHVEESAWLEEALQVQAAYLDHLFEAAPEAIALLDGRTRIMRVNAQYTRLFGYSAEEAIGRSAADLTIPPDAAEEAKAIGRRALRGEQAKVEVVRRRKDGSKVHVSLLTIPVRLSRDQGGIYTIFRDLSPEREAQEELQRRDERYRSLIENAMDVVAIVAPGGSLEYITPSIERLLGYTPAQLVGTSAFALLHPDDATDAISRFTATTRSDCSDSAEYRLKSSSGQWRTFEVRARNMTEDPAVAGVVLNARDVTDERIAKETQRRLGAFLDATPDFVAIFDPRGRALLVNRAFRTVLGLPAESRLSELTIDDLFPARVTDRLLHEGIPAAARDGIWSGETFLRNAESEDIPVAQLVLAHRSADGAVEFVSTLARDVRAQKEAENALRRSEEHFRSLIENALDLIVILDADGRILFASPSVRTVLGFEPDELIGTTVFDLAHPEEREEMTRSFTHSLEAGEMRTAVEFRVATKDGEWRLLESVGENLLDDPAVGGIVVNSRDVTERRRAEEALRESQQQLLQSQKMEAVGRLAGGIAHDFNNLLTAIKGFTELLLLDLEEQDPRRAFAAEIQGAAGRAAGLTRQLLAFSRRQVLQPEVLDLNTTVVEMENMLERMVGEDLRIVTSLDPDLGRVRADPGQLEQVVMNLVVNARDAMPRGGEIRIETANAVLTDQDARVYPYVETGPYVVLEVSDTGSGMSAEVRERVFEPFFTTKEQGKGTGLGLSTVYGIVKQSGGYVWVESKVGVGTTFRIHLPRVDEEPSPRPQEARPAGATRGNESVLLVEDELAVRTLVRRVLDRAGYRVIEAASGPEALDRLAERAGALDLLLTDVVMPGMSGAELADHIAERHPEARVLYMSGYTDEAIGRHGVLDADVAFLGKPFSPDLLLQKVREVLDRPARAPDR